MPALRLFDTAKGSVVTLGAAGEQSMYVCGITPYDATHMGHAASYVAFDLLNRAWRDGRQQVAYVQNVTDVDDPLLERATATGVDWRELAASQIKLFQTDMEALNVLAPDHYVGAVEAIPLIVPAIERLVERGLAYRVAGTAGEPDGDVYYDVEAAGKHSAEASDAWTLGAVSGLSDAEMLGLASDENPYFRKHGECPEPGQDYHVHHRRLRPTRWPSGECGMHAALPGLWIRSRRYEAESHRALSGRWPGACRLVRRQRDRRVENPIQPRLQPPRRRCRKVESRLVWPGGKQRLVEPAELTVQGISRPLGIGCRSEGSLGVGSFRISSESLDSKTLIFTP